MFRSISASALAVVATLAVAGAAAAKPISEPASCAGYLASYANPNNGFIIHAIVMPIADSLGVTVGQVTVWNAQAHNGGIEACIPE
ncbi:MAG: hypothetical protein ABIZ52_00875 [Candidatus Limnocylindrales bacterium]